MSQFTITSGTFEKQVKRCGKHSAHILLPASLQEKTCRVDIDIYDKKGLLTEQIDEIITLAICGSSCHLKVSKDYLGMNVKGLITLIDKKN